MSYDLAKETQEAIDAGNKALTMLKKARHDLGSAGNWGLLDMFGGGAFTTMIKRSKMNDAKRNMEQAKFALRRFSKEVKDVSMNLPLEMETDGFLSFADFFMDGFFVDWMVQSQINRAKGQVDEAIRRVEFVLKQLETYC